MELHPFTQERLNDLEIDYRRHEAQFGKACIEKILLRLSQLEEKPELSVEGVDARLTALSKEFKDHVEGAVTLKKIKLVVEDSIEAQQSQIKRVRTKANELEESLDRVFAWRDEIEDQVKLLRDSIDDRFSGLNHQIVLKLPSLVQD